MIPNTSSIRDSLSISTMSLLWGSIDVVQRLPVAYSHRSISTQYLHVYFSFDMTAKMLFKFRRLH